MGLAQIRRKEHALGYLCVFHSFLCAFTISSHGVLLQSLRWPWDFSCGSLWITHCVWKTYEHSWPWSYSLCVSETQCLTGCIRGKHVLNSRFLTKTLKSCEMLGAFISLHYVLCIEGLGYIMAKKSADFISNLTSAYSGLVVWKVRIGFNWNIYWILSHNICWPVTSSLDLMNSLSNKEVEYKCYCCWAILTPFHWLNNWFIFSRVVAL